MRTTERDRAVRWGRSTISRLARIVLFVTAACPMWPPATRAAETCFDLSRLAAMSLEELSEIPVYSVVAASKRVQASNRVAAQATVVTAEEIRQYGCRTLADGLRSVPGCQAISDRRYGFVGVCGPGMLGDFGGRILLMLDGHKMNDPLYDSEAIPEESIVDMDLFDRVEIISGPGAALCGNNAYLAVINLVTRHADKIGRGELSLGGGTHGSVDGPARRVTEGAGRTSPGCGHDSVTFTLAGSSRKRDLRSFSLFVARPGV